MHFRKDDPVMMKVKSDMFTEKTRFVRLTEQNDELLIVAASGNKQNQQDMLYETHEC